MSSKQWTGVRIGRIVVTGHAEPWACKCDCGASFLCNTKSLQRKRLNGRASCCDTCPLLKASKAGFMWKTALPRPRVASGEK